MKTSSLRVDFALRETIRRRRAQVEFVAHGQTLDEGKKLAETYHPAAVVHAELQRRLDRHRKQVLG